MCNTYIYILGNQWDQEFLSLGINWHISLLFFHSILIPHYWLLIPFLNIIFFWGNNTEDYWTSGLMSRARAQPLSYNPNWISFSHNYKPSTGMGFQGDFFIAVPSSYKQSAICVLGRGALMFMRGVASSGRISSVFLNCTWVYRDRVESSGEGEGLA